MDSDADGLRTVAKGFQCGSHLLQPSCRGVKNGGHFRESGLALLGPSFLHFQDLRNRPLSMDNFEEIGRRIDVEMERLRRYVDEELAPETERRTASFLRDVSGKLDQFAKKLEARMARRGPSSPENPPPPQDPQS